MNTREQQAKEILIRVRDFILFLESYHPDVTAGTMRHELSAEVDAWLGLGVKQADSGIVYTRRINQRGAAAEVYDDVKYLAEHLE